MTRPIVLAALLVAVASLPAQAQTVKVEFLMGKVNLVAQDASLRAILNEWSRVGGTQVVNPERLTGGPVTLELKGVPERQALDILMREVGGYILGPRAALVAGVSSFDRLVVVSAAAGRPQPAAAGRGVPAPRPQLGRVATPIEREPVVDDQNDDVEPDSPDLSDPAARLRRGAPRWDRDCLRSRALSSPRPSRRVPRRATRSERSRDASRPGTITAPPSSTRDIQQPQESQPQN